jgi:Phage terminase, small subunit
MVAGRKPLPAAVKRAAGNPGKRALPEAMPTPQAVYLDAPEWLRAYPFGAQCWSAVQDELYRLGLLNPLSAPILAEWCYTMQLLADIRAVLKECGEVEEGAGGGLFYTTKGRNGVQHKAHPALGHYRETLARASSLAAAFGMTPEGQHRMGGQAQPDLFGGAPASQAKQGAPGDPAKPRANPFEQFKGRLAPIQHRPADPDLSETQPQGNA